MKEEIWKDVKGYENIYQVSNTGKIKSLNYNHTGREKIMNPSVDKDGYQRVCLRKNRKFKNFRVHRLVAEAFIPNPNNLSFINHKSEIKTQNNVENLEWCDAKYNNNYGTRKERVAEKQINGKKSKPVLKIDPISNEIVAEYPSLREVQRQLGYSKGNISKCCNNKPKYNTAYGYKWKYK